MESDAIFMNTPLDVSLIHLFIILTQSLRAVVRFQFMSSVALIIYMQNSSNNPCPELLTGLLFPIES